MKDGPPESQEPKPEGETRTPSEAYKEDVKKAWDNYRKHGDKVQLGLELGQAVADFAMRGGPGVLEAFGNLLGSGK